MEDIAIIAESLHPLERKVLPYLAKCNDLRELMKETKMSDVEVMRALQWLENKEILKIISDVKETLVLDENGIFYAEKGLPERRFLEAIKNKSIPMKNMEKESGLLRDEITVCLGLLKKKVAINLDKGNITITSQGEKILSKEWLEETFLAKIAKGGIDLTLLTPEEKFAYDIFVKRKGIVKTEIEKIKRYELSDGGKKLTKIKINESNLIERVTPEMLKDGSWKDKTFRRYDVKINVPKIERGRTHFVNQSIDHIKKVWLEMGFSEMSGQMVQTSFWTFDALFTAQDHPVREMQDTFFIKDPAIGKLPSPKIVDGIKSAHENGAGTGSTGWQYKWNADEAKKNVLRTHTTAVSIKTISELSEADLPAKIFTIGKNFRNETVDWSHLFEFYQVEGIVIDPNANFRHLLGYLKEFYKKMGYEKIRIRPAYFAYTEPSVEVDVYHPGRKTWMELGGAGIFRPEVVVPLLGKYVPVLAWGQGLERGIMDYYGINDVRDLYKNNLKQIRDMKEWML